MKLLVDITQCVKMRKTLLVIEEEMQISWVTKQMAFCT